MVILFIDDNVGIVEMVAEFLKKKGKDCTVTNDPKKGLELIKKSKYDTIFLDLAMPGFSGFDVIKALEKDGLLEQQKIVLYTASSVADNEIDELLEKKGVHSILRKPAALADLLKVINS